MDLGDPVLLNDFCLASDDVVCINIHAGSIITQNVNMISGVIYQSFISSSAASPLEGAKHQE